MIKVLGLMTCFNRKDKTVRALKNLIQGNPEIDFSFIVADDASTDGTAQALKEFKTVTKEEVINISKKIKLNTIYLLKGEDK